MNRKDYIVFTSMDIDQILTSRPHALINYLSSIPEWSTFIYRLEPMERCVTKSRKKGDVSIFGLMFPLMSKVFMPLVGIWFFLYVYLIDRFKYRVAMGMGPWAGLSCILLKLVGRVERFVYSDFDFFPGFQKNPFLKKMVSLAEVLCLRNADLVVSVSSLLAEKRREQGAGRIVVVPNGVDYELF